MLKIMKFSFLKLFYEFSNSKNHNALSYNKLKLPLFNLKSTAYKNLNIEFKLHLVVDDCGKSFHFQLHAAMLITGFLSPQMTKNFIGKLFGDKGYISKKLTELLALDDVELITKLKKNMKPKIIALFDKIMLRKRSIIETINDQLKNISQIERSRHRSLTNCMINVVAGLLAYSY